MGPMRDAKIHSAVVSDTSSDSSSGSEAEEVKRDLKIPIVVGLCALIVVVVVVVGVVVKLCTDTNKLNEFTPDNFKDFLVKVGVEFPKGGEGLHQLNLHVSKDDDGEKKGSSESGMVVYNQIAAFSLMVDLFRLILEEGPQAAMATPDNPGVTMMQDMIKARPKLTVKKEQVTGGTSDIVVNVAFAKDIISMEAGSHKADFSIVKLKSECDFPTELPTTDEEVREIVELFQKKVEEQLKIDL